MEELSAEMEALRAGFESAFTAAAGFFFPYRLTPSSSTPFWGNVWAADVRGAAYARAVTQAPDLAQSDVRFLVVKPGDTPPEQFDTIPFEGGLLTLHFWGQTDPLSGEAMAACSWSI